MTPRSTPTSRIQTRSVELDSASGSPAEKPRKSTISTRGLRETASVSAKLGRAVAVSGVTVIGQLSSSWRADTRLAARLRQKVIGRSLARHLRADRRISVCEEGHAVIRIILDSAHTAGMAAEDE